MLLQVVFQTCRKNCYERQHDPSILRSGTGSHKASLMWGRYSSRFRSYWAIIQSALQSKARYTVVHNIYLLSFFPRETNWCLHPLPRCISCSSTASHNHTQRVRSPLCLMVAVWSPKLGPFKDWRTDVKKRLDHLLNQGLFIYPFCFTEWLYGTALRWGLSPSIPNKYEATLPRMQSFYRIHRSPKGRVSIFFGFNLNCAIAKTERQYHSSKSHSGNVANI